MNESEERSDAPVPVSNEEKKVDTEPAASPTYDPLFGNGNDTAFGGIGARD